MMDYSKATELWFYTGLVLMLLELVVPGLISIFLGMGALTVAAFMWKGHLSLTTSQLLVWFASSLVYILLLRAWFLKFFPQDHKVGVIDEDEVLYGKEVLVVEDIPSEGTGRIHLSNSTWTARSGDNQAHPQGSKVLIQGRENITYIVVANKGEN